MTESNNRSHFESLIKQTDQPCNEHHTIGIWHREGSYLILQCNCGHWLQKIDIDTPQGYEVFEMQSLLWLDGEFCCHPADPDTAEKIGQSDGESLK